MFWSSSQTAHEALDDAGRVQQDWMARTALKAIMTGRIVAIVGLMAFFTLGLQNSVCAYR